MPSVDTEVAHNLPVADAALRVRGLMTRLRARYDGKITNVDEWWGADRGDFSFSFSGLRIKGTVDVLPGRVRARVELPLAALPFRGTIRDAVHDQLAACLR